MPCDTAAPQPSPEPTSSLKAPPPIRKSSVVRCLHELQDPASPTKAPKLARTHSVLNVPVISLGESAVLVPINLNNCLTEPLPFASVIEDLDAVLDEHYKSDDPKGKRPMDPRVEQLSQAVHNDSDDESVDSDAKDKDMDVDAKDAADAKTSPCPAKSTLMSSVRKKSMTGSSSAYNSASLDSILDTPPTSKRMSFDPRVTPDAKSLFDLDYGLFAGEK